MYLRRAEVHDVCQQLGDVLRHSLPLEEETGGFTANLSLACRRMRTANSYRVQILRTETLSCPFENPERKKQYFRDYIGLSPNDAETGRAIAGPACLVWLEMGCFIEGLRAAEYCWLCFINADNSFAVPLRTDNSSTWTVNFLFCSSSALILLAAFAPR